MYVFQLCDQLKESFELVQEALSRMQERGEITGFVPNDEYAFVELTGKTRAVMILNGDGHD